MRSNNCTRRAFAPDTLWIRKHDKLFIADFSVVLSQEKNKQTNKKRKRKTNAFPLCSCGPSCCYYVNLRKLFIQQLPHFNVKLFNLFVFNVIIIIAISSPSMLTC